MSRKYRLAWLVLPLFLPLLACGLNSAKKQYVVAEKLWTDGKYRAAVNEFQKVHARDPNGKLGQQALYRAAMTQAYFLGQYPEALKKFRAYAASAREPGAVLEAQWQIGELLFSRMEQYEQAAQHYSELLKSLPADHPELGLVRFRIGKANFYLLRFDRAIQAYQELIQALPASPFAERAAYEIGMSYFTRGEKQQEKNHDSFKRAIQVFQEFQTRYPQSKLNPEARFGIASCYEAMNRLDEAYRIFSELKSSYPTPSVIEIKLARIHERRTQTQGGH